VPQHCPPDLREFIEREAGALGAMIMGAGGGGYVAFVAESIPENAIPIKVRREVL
jgi:galactokinase/mevalonate kinase-like predicted kinase